MLRHGNCKNVIGISITLATCAVSFGDTPQMFLTFMQSVVQQDKRRWHPTGSKTRTEPCASGMESGHSLCHGERGCQISGAALSQGLQSLRGCRISGAALNKNQRPPIFRAHAANNHTLHFLLHLSSPSHAFYSLTATLTPDFSFFLYGSQFSVITPVNQPALYCELRFPREMCTGSVTILRVG